MTQTQRVKFRLIYKGRINGYERLTPEGWQWMALDLNPEGRENWHRGVFPYGFSYERNQFTGLPDKHGKEIYEGDIIALKNSDGTIKYRYVVKFEDGKFVLYHTIKQYGKWGDLYRIFDYDFREYDFVVIGDIHTTPDLIQKT